MAIRKLLVTGATLLTALAVAPAAAQVKDHRDIQYPALPEFKVQQPKRFILDNGMQVFLQEDHELPLISVTARIRTGAYYEPAAQVGLADLMATVQRTGGTTKMSGDEIDEYLAERAASVETGMGGRAGFASMSCLRDDFDEVFAVFHDVLRTPRFEADKLDVAKVQSRTSIARRNDSIGAITGREFSRLIYGADSPIGRLEEYATIAAISREDLVAFHGKYYVPNNVYLGVVGDFDTATMLGKIESAFADWAKGEPATPFEMTVAEPQPGVYFIEKTDVTQANIAIGHLGIERTNPDYFAVEVMNEILGGGFDARLFSNVRSKKGLAYSVGGGIGASTGYPGVFRISLQTKSETMAAGVEAIKEEMLGMLDRPPSPEELRKAKEAILNSFVFNYDSKAEILGQQIAYAYDGLPSDFLERYRSNIERVTLADVNRVTKKYLHADKLVLLVVGKPTDFDRPVNTFGEVATIDITIPAPPDAAPVVARTDRSLRQGSSTLSRAFRALGGEAPPSIEAVRWASKGALKLGGQSLSVNSNLLVVYPDRFRQELQLPIGSVLVVSAGAGGFRSMGGQVMDLSSEERTGFRENLHRDLTFLLQNRDDPGLEALSAGSDQVDGVNCDVVAVKFQGTESRLWVAADGTVIKQAWEGKHPVQGTPGRIELLFSDHRPVEGLTVPFKHRMLFDGQEVMEMTLESFEIDPQLDGSEFDRPGS